LICKYCEKEIEPVTEEKVFSNGTKHISASCPLCKKWLKYLPQGGEAVLYFGKYKGQRISEVAKIDPEYLHWLYGATDKDKIRKQIDKAFED